MREVNRDMQISNVTESDLKINWLALFACIVTTKSADEIIQLMSM